MFDAEVHVITISSNRNKKDLERLESYSNQVEGQLHARQIRTVRKTLVGPNLADLTCNYAEAVNAGLIVIMSGDLDKWNLMLGSFAQQMINKTSVPLLNVTPQEKYIHPGFSTFGG